jgi:NADH-quinone oxidoreductase subunit L
MSFAILIPLLPLLACLLLAVAGRRLGEASHKVGSAAVGASFALSVAAFVQILRHGPQAIGLYRFLDTGNLIVDFGFRVDELSVMVLLLVTGVSTIVHVYSSRYMIGDPRYPRFFAVMALFTAAMATLVMSRNLLMTYMCWEAMGICSYLLISHWAQRKAAGAAALKAFLVNAVADVGLGLGVLLTFQTFGTLDIPTILERAGTITGQQVNLLSWVGLEWLVPTATLIPLLLFTGAMGKSAQLPFHVWLPFAMEAPTPVSALIHAATMVNAGPFLLLRFSPLLLLAPTAMTVIAVVGAATALFASVVAMTQSDIKKTLAYSTIGQIGFMIMACGVGAFAAALFHLLAHGFLKAFLFLSTGSVLQALTPRSAHDSHAQPGQSWTPSWALSLGALLLAFVPPAILFSGSYEGLWTLHGVPAASFVFWALALVTVFLTAAYLFRAVAALFQEELAASGTLLRPRLFSVPHIGIVATGALVLIGFFYEFPRWFTAFVSPALPPASALLEPVARNPFPAWPLMPFAAAIGGWALALYLHRRPGPMAAGGMLKSLYVLFWNKLYFDEIYDVFVVAPNLRFAQRLAATVERGIVDRIVNLTVSGSIHTSRWLWRVLEGRGLDTAVSSTATASMVTAGWLWRVLEGRMVHGTVAQLTHQTEAVSRFLHRREMHTLQEHLLLIAAGLAGLLGLFYFFIDGSWP